MLTIKSKSFVSENGKREINEDCIEFESGKFYIVCDGLGGNGNGKTASKLVAETVKESLLNLKSISEAVKDAEIVLSSYKKKNPSTDYMATTIAIAEILENEILVSWAGDSRVYHFRNGKTLFKSTDHTWVVDAVKKGVLSSVEALFHPRVNELTKSIKDASKPVKLEQVLIEDIRLNDYFLICSDGVTESWIDTDLQELFSGKKTSNDIVNELNKNCNVFSEDNYSAIVFNLVK
jgi:protein phosphatase